MCIRDRKEGKWCKDGKAETKVEGSFYEYGKMPKQKEENSPKMSQLLESIRSGKDTVEILEETPEFAFRIKEIEILRETLLSDRYQRENRMLEVAYIFGAAGTGKTSGIYQKHDPRDVCRAVSYTHLDVYKRQGKRRVS